MPSPGRSGFCFALPDDRGCACLRHNQQVLTLKCTAQLGGDGFALWYSASPLPPGDAMGSDGTWKGLGVFFDSFDDDGKVWSPIGPLGVILTR